MYESYRKFSDNKIQQIIIFIFIGIGFIYTALSGLIYDKSYAVFALFKSIVFIAPACILVGLTTYLRCSYSANDMCVTFRQPFRKKTVICYCDIDEIKVSHEYKERINNKGRYKRFYVEHIEIKTFDGERFTHNAIMDIEYNSFAEISGMMDMAFEKGIFKNLQRYISSKEAL